MKWIIGGCLVFALVLAITLTYVDGKGCALGFKQSPALCHTHDDYLRTGWPIAWNTEPGRFIEEAGISYTLFVFDAAVLFLIIGGASLLTVWYFWTKPWERTASGSRSAAIEPDH